MSPAAAPGFFFVLQEVGHPYAHSVWGRPFFVCRHSRLTIGLISSHYIRSFSSRRRNSSYISNNYNSLSTACSRHMGADHHAQMSSFFLGFFFALPNRPVHLEKAFESKRLMQAMDRTGRFPGAAEEQIREKRIRPALALSTRISLMSGHREAFRAQRLLAKIGIDCDAVISARRGSLRSRKPAFLACASGINCGRLCTLRPCEHGWLYAAGKQLAVEKIMWDIQSGPVGTW